VIDVLIAVPPRVRHRCHADFAEIRGEAPPLFLELGDLRGNDGDILASLREYRPVRDRRGS
jgi:hypothetical protein